MTPEEFDRAAVLTVGQIARVAGMKNNRTTLRLLRGGGVPILRAGRRHVVERLALRTAMPGFYEALVTKVAEQSADWS